MPFVQYVASLAVLQGVQQQARSRLRDCGIDMRIKWPNDLYIGSLKVRDVVACLPPGCRTLNDATPPSMLLSCRRCGRVTCLNHCTLSHLGKLAPSTTACTVRV